MPLASRINRTYNDDFYGADVAPAPTANPPRQPYEPKPSLRERIHDVALTETQDGGADMVILTGYYGERGIAFYPFESAQDDGSVVGFSLLGKGANPQHTNLNRDQATALVAFLIQQYDMNVETEYIVTENIIVE